MEKADWDKITSQFADIIDQNVQIDIPNTQLKFFNNKQDKLELKIDLIEKIIELVKIKNKHIDNNLPIEYLLQGALTINKESIHFYGSSQTLDLGSGTKPILLQPKLLLFLLYRHDRGYYEIYSIIEDFIKTIWDSLEPLDFKKTKTGVFRCFTNTRFAANTLRKYGLLKYTRKQAYKTWILSLPGLIVASKLMENPDWSLSIIEKDWSCELHPDIRHAFKDLKNYEAFVKRMMTICKEKHDAFEEFKAESLRAYVLLDRYWSILNADSLNRKEIEKESMKVSKEIEQDLGIELFYNHFCNLIKVGDILSQK